MISSHFSPFVWQSITPSAVALPSHYWNCLCHSKSVSCPAFPIHRSAIQFICHVMQRTSATYHRISKLFLAFAINLLAFPLQFISSHFHCNSRPCLANALHFITLPSQRYTFLCNSNAELFFSTLCHRKSSRLISFPSPRQTPRFHSFPLQHNTLLFCAIPLQCLGLLFRYRLPPTRSPFSSSASHRKRPFPEFLHCPSPLYFP